MSRRASGVGPDRRRNSLRSATPSGFDIQAFGAFSQGGVLPGTDNRVEILLKGVSQDARLSIVDSQPPDPAGTNTVLVLKP